MSPTRLRVKTVDPAPTKAILGIRPPLLSRRRRVSGYVNVSPTLARCIAIAVNTSQLNASSMLTNSRNGTSWTVYGEPAVNRRQAMISPR